MMKNDVIKTKRRRIILDECNVMAALKVINDVRSISRFSMPLSMEIGTCGYVDGEESIWFIHYNSNEKQWREVIRTLNDENYQLVLKDDGYFYLRKES